MIVDCQSLPAKRVGCTRVKAQKKAEVEVMASTGRPAAETN